MADPAEIPTASEQDIRTWEQVENDLITLADQIEAECAETGLRFDKIVMIPRGSLAPVNILSRRLGASAEDMLTVAITSYGDGEEEAGAFKYGQMPDDVTGLKLLIIDEVCDTGATLQHAKDLLESAGAAYVASAVIDFKPKKSVNGYIPDWYVNTTEKWIVYPWEKHETVGKNSEVLRRAAQSAGEMTVSMSNDIVTDEPPVPPELEPVA